MKFVRSIIVVCVALLGLFFAMLQIDTSYKGNFSNSVFKSSFLQGKTVMVFVPHEDDELNVAGLTIKNLRDNNIRTICVFATNGDWYPVKKRVAEARESLRILGVPDKDIYFLGYADGPASQKYYDKYTAPGNVVLVAPKTKKLETYCVLGKSDFGTLLRGKHSSYTRNAFKRDIMDIILKFKPDIIIATDFDKHLNHRENSLFFEEVMGDILRMPKNNYRPEVLKGFAYSTAYTAVADFYAPNILSAQKPDKKELNNPLYETDIPQYEWSKRLRLPANKECLTRLLKGNTLFAALQAHKSQDTVKRAPRIINGDQVFWERYTSGLAYEGKVTVSSGHGEKLNDFKLVDVTDLHNRHVIFDNYLWSPAASDKEKTATITWPKGQTIDKIILYGNIEDSSRIEVGSIELSNGFRVEVPELKAGGRATVIKIAPQQNILWLKFSMKKWRGKTPGLAELEIYGGKPPIEFFNLVKITVNGDFVYDYWVRRDIEKLDLGIYKFGNVGKCKLIIVAGKGRLQGNELFLDSDDIIVRAEDENGLFDQVVIHRKPVWYFWCLRLKQLVEKRMLKV
ncbi:MAG: PIG-L family deacetylase [Acidaminococcaceae bacterium]|nr:PIG-L family deacetylase [Acidaminococcaceae bacterium]